VVILGQLLMPNSIELWGPVSRLRVIAGDEEVSGFRREISFISYRQHANPNSSSSGS
jgi:hypothetical protein